MQLKKFSKWLDDLLVPSDFKDFCPDGLCVEASGTVTKVVTGVSSSEDLLDAAVSAGADCVIVHHPHGFWNNERRIPVGPLARKIKKLMTAGVNLYGFHLPLDAHPEIGNNAQIARALGLENLDWFMMEGKRPIACAGSYSAGISAAEFTSRLDRAFPKGYLKFFYGADDISKVAVCSGSAGVPGMEEAFAQGADVFVTGEIKESSPIYLKENRLDLIAAGHHRTEVFGVRALASRIKEELRIPAEFIDIDNPI